MVERTRYEDRTRFALYIVNISLLISNFIIALNAHKGFSTKMILNLAIVIMTAYMMTILIILKRRYENPKLILSIFSFVLCINNFAFDIICYEKQYPHVFDSIYIFILIIKLLTSVVFNFALYAS